MNENNIKVKYIKNAESIISILEDMSKDAKNHSKVLSMVFVYYNMIRNIYDDKESMQHTYQFCDLFGTCALDKKDITSVVMGKGIQTENLKYNKAGYYLLSRKQIADLLELTEEEITRYGLFDNQIKTKKRADNKVTNAELKRVAFELHKRGKSSVEIGKIINRSDRTVRSWLADTKAYIVDSEKNKNEAIELINSIQTKISEGCNVCITGPAGTGKTELIKTIIDNGENVIVTAPTNLALSNYENGYTLHSLFNIPIKIKLSELVDKSDASNWKSNYTNSKRDIEKVELLENINTLIIDEIGNVRFDVFVFTMMRVRQIEKYRGKPIQIIVVGDWNQLAPVIDKDEYVTLKKMWGKLWKGKTGFAYETNIWEECDFALFELEYVFRQTEPRFKLLLDAIMREDKRGVENNLVMHIDNTKMYSNDAPHICGHNAMVNDINSTIIHNYCEDNKDFKVIEYRGEREARYYKDYYPVELNMVLFKGMYVAFVENGENYSKGSLAKIIRINEETVTVIMLNNETTLKIKRKLFASNEKNIKPIEQYPFKPAFAITVHSAQGQTFNRAYVHTDMFAKKQFYVAVSRVRTLEGLTIVGDITKQIFGKEAVWPIICDE